MDQFIQNFHSGTAYLVLLGLLLLVIVGIIGLAGLKSISKFDRILVKVTTGLIHLQALAGILLWIVSSKVQAYMKDVAATMGNSEHRKILLEHPIMMLIAVIVFTIASKKITKAATDAIAYKNMLIYGLITLAIILAMIPWGVFMGGVLA